MAAILLPGAICSTELAFKRNAMVKVEVKTRTTFIIDLPIKSFDEISEPMMTIEESDEFIKDFLRDKLETMVDEILCVNTV